MQPIDRRRFVCAASAAGGLFALPGWLAAFRGPQDPQPAAPARTKRAAQLRAAFVRSVDEGRPLLVFVVPPAPRERERGNLFGALLNHGGPDALLEIALCVPACGTIADVEQLTGLTITGDPLLLLVDGGAPKTTATPIAPALAELPAWDMAKQGYQARVDAETAHFRACIERITSALRDGLQAAGCTLPRLAGRVRERLRPEAAAALERFARGDAAPADALLVCATACVRVAAATQAAAARDATLAALAAAVERVLLGERLPGSRWATATPCGTEIENPGPGEQVLGGPCGTGHVPDMARRFLTFLTS